MGAIVHNHLADMMVELRPFEETGETESGALSGRHHFCFSTFQRADRIDWGVLRALHMFELAVGGVRPVRFHAGFEILTLVLAGSLRRTGTFHPRQPIGAGSAELVSTGMGVDLGLEAAGDEAASFLEIWVSPDASGRRARRDWRDPAAHGLDTPVASFRRDVGRTLLWRSRSACWRVTLDADAHIDLAIGADEHAFVLILAGELDTGRFVAGPGDAIAARGCECLKLVARSPCELVLLRELP